MGIYGLTYSLYHPRGARLKVEVGLNIGRGIEGNNALSR